MAVHHQMNWKKDVCLESISFSMVTRMGSKCMVRSAVLVACFFLVVLLLLYYLPIYVQLAIQIWTYGSQTHTHMSMPKIPYFTVFLPFWKFQYLYKVPLELSTWYIKCYLSVLAVYDLTYLPFFRDQNLNRWRRKYASFHHSSRQHFLERSMLILVELWPGSCCVTFSFSSFSWFKYLFLFWIFFCPSIHA